MDDKCPSSPATARDVAGAWLVCVLIAILALGLVGYRHGGVAPAATAATEIVACPPASGFKCPSSGELVGFMAGLHRLTPPMVRPDEKQRRG